MDLTSFRNIHRNSHQFASLSAPLQALWLEHHGDWTAAHQLVDELETRDGMAVHAYLHRREGETGNADYWYRRAGRDCYRDDESEEWAALVNALL